MSPYDAQDVHSLALENAKIMTRLDGIGDAVGDLKNEFKELRSDLRSDRETYVPRTEFEDYKTTRDREIKDLKDKDKSKTAVWTSVAAIVVATVGGLIGLIQAIQ